MTETDTLANRIGPVCSVVSPTDAEAESFAERKTVQINGLRVYVKTGSADSGNVTFYSRRADGPYYRWSYEDRRELWRGARVQSADLDPRELCVAKWKGLSPELQITLVDHYLE